MISFIQKLLDRFDKERDKCFEDSKTTDGKCYGQVGNDKSTNYLALECVDCPHHTMV